MYTYDQHEYIMAMIRANVADLVKPPSSLTHSEVEACRAIARTQINKPTEKALWRTMYPGPERVQILNEGARLTAGDRDKEYGPPAVNMACAGALKKALREHMTRDISPAELEAIDMALTKIGRLATGAPKRDTYVDAATYLAIAGEIGLSAKSE